MKRRRFTFIDKPEPGCAVFKQVLRDEQLPQPETEYRFCQTRMFRFDYAWPARKVALEVDGGIFTGGRHTRGEGFKRDMEKFNCAACLGWRILRVQPKELTHTTTMGLIRAALSHNT